MVFFFDIWDPDSVICHIYSEAPALGDDILPDSCISFIPVYDAVGHCLRYCGLQIRSPSSVDSLCGRMKPQPLLPVLHLLPAVVPDYYFICVFHHNTLLFTCRLFTSTDFTYFPTPDSRRSFCNMTVHIDNLHTFPPHTKCPISPHQQADPGTVHKII